MKKTLFVLIAALALGVMSCDRTIPRVDVVIINHGQMQFYNHATQKLTPYEAETDSVVNVLFDKSDHLFYTAAHQQALTLKSLDLTESHPQPKVCASWKLTLDQITDWVYGTGAEGMFLDEALENLYLMRGSFEDDDPIYAEAFNIASGTKKELSFEEYEPISGLSIALDHFYSEQEKFYYATPEGKVCLNDQIDIRSDNHDKFAWGDVEYLPVKMSQDGKKIVFEYTYEVEGGYGRYCVADSDGQHQTLLKDSNMWTISPEWLADGSMIYVGGEPRPESDPDYDAEWNTTRYCIKIIDPQGVASLLASDAEVYYVNPVEPLKPREKQNSMYGCDMAIVDNGKLTFYNSTDNTFVPMVIEKDRVVSATFVEEDCLYYTVAIGDRLYLKTLYTASFMGPYMVTDWDLKLGDCYSENCGMVSPMHHVIAKSADDPYGVLLVGIDCGLDEDLCVFSGVKYYNNESGVITDYWPAEYNTDDEFAEREKLMKELKLTNLSRFDLNIPSEVEENKLEVYSISPSHDRIAYAYYTELGPKGGSGPLCFATVDGKMKMALEGTDVQNMYYGWLSDGRLAYSDKEGIKAVAADGTITKISDGKIFVTVH